MATHDTKKLFMNQRLLEIRITDMPNLSLKSRKNIQVLSLTKTIKNSFFIEGLKLLKLLKEGFLLRSGLLILLFWHFGNTAWKVSRYGAFFWSVFSHIRPEFGTILHSKIRAGKNSVFGQLSRKAMRETCISLSLIVHPFRFLYVFPWFNKLERKFSIKYPLSPIED